MNYSVACFGKLPLAADFIRHNASGPEVHQLDRWLSEGIVKAQEALGEDGWREAYEATGPVRFLIRQAGGKAFTIGVKVPGRDKPGRLFPFLVFTTVDGRAVRKQPAILPLLFAEFLDRAELFVTGGWQQVEDSQGLRAQLEALSGSVDHREAAQRLDAGLKSRTTGQLWGSSFGDPHDNRRFILLMNLRSLLDTRSKPRFTLQLPGGSADDIAFWLTAVCELRGLDGFPELAAWNSAGDLRLLLVPPAGEHYRSLFLEREDPETICSLADEGLESEDMLRKARDAYGPLGEDLTLSLGDLLAKLRRTSLP